MAEKIARVVDARSTAIETAVEEAAHVVFGGGTVIFPTDTSYCIACDPYRSEAVDRIYAAKARADAAPLTLHLASPAEFLEYAGETPLASFAARRLLPGPILLLVAAPAFVPDQVTAGLRTVALRVPDDPLARAILERCGPLAGTSANRERRYDGGDDRSMLPEADLLVQHGPARYEREATIVDVSGPRARLMREGVVDAARLAELLGYIERPTVKVRTHT